MILAVVMDEQTVALATVIAGVIVAVLRFFDGRDRRRAEERAARRHDEQGLVIAAAAERSRIRDGRRRRSSHRAASPAPEFVSEETTDMHELVELERQDRAKRDTDKQARDRGRRGERQPRPGTVDKPYEDE